MLQSFRVVVVDANDVTEVAVVVDVVVVPAHWCRDKYAHCHDRPTVVFLSDLRRGPHKKHPRAVFFELLRTLRHLSVSDNPRYLGPFGLLANSLFFMAS